MGSWTLHRGATSWVRPKVGVLNSECFRYKSPIPEVGFGFGGQGLQMLIERSGGSVG